jgi:hypothetical protein
MATNMKEAWPKHSLKEIWELCGVIQRGIGMLRGLLSTWDKNLVAEKLVAAANGEDADPGEESVAWEWRWPTLLLRGGELRSTVVVVTLVDRDRVSRNRIPLVDVMLLLLLLFRWADEENGRDRMIERCWRAPAPLESNKAVR